MANGNDTADLVGPGADAGAGADSGIAAGPPAGAQQGQGPPQGGGPIIAALARQQHGPQASAPGPGNHATGLNLLNQATAFIRQAIPMLQPGPALQAALRAATQLSRHADQGQPTAGVQMTQARDLIRGLVRNAMLQRIMQQQQQGGGQGGGQGGQPPAPMPTTPQPGA